MAGSYLLGCLTTGYYLVRWTCGADIRTEGSGSTGATNVARKLGKAGFLTTFSLDLAKGALAAYLAKSYELEDPVRLSCGLAVIAGHIWPIQLRFRGGKGAATLLGVLLIFDIGSVGIMASACLGSFVLLRRFTLSGVIAMAVTPLLAALLLTPSRRALNVLLLVLPVLFTHRQNLREDVGWIRNLFSEKTPEGGQNGRKAPGKGENGSSSG